MTLYVIPKNKGRTEKNCFVVQPYNTLYTLYCRVYTQYYTKMSEKTGFFKMFKPSHADSMKRCQDQVMGNIIQGIGVDSYDKSATHF